MRTILPIDDINKVYEISDRYIRYIAKHNIDAYEEALGYLNLARPKKIVDYCGEMYEELYGFAFNTYLRLANEVLKKYGGKQTDSSFLHKLFSFPDPVTRFIFKNEAERKRGRLEESLIATDNRADALGKALKDWSRTVNQLTISVTDAALVQAYKDNGVRFVKWVAVKDTRCCEECFEYDGKIFPIDKIPAKPHWNCRCRLIGMIDDGRSNKAD